MGSNLKDEVHSIIINHMYDIEIGGDKLASARKLSTTKSYRKVNTTEFIKGTNHTISRDKTIAY